MPGALDNYWDSIANARDLASLRDAISGDQGAARLALSELLELLNKIEPLQASFALDLLRYLGADIADAAGEANIAAELQGTRLLLAGTHTLDGGMKQDAAALLFESASCTMKIADPAAAVRTTLNPMVMLFRMGEFDKGLELAEKLLETVEARIYETQPTRLAIYDLAKITPKAPAGDRWANLLARIHEGMHRAGDEPLAATTRMQLSGTLVRCGALEDSLELLTDAEPLLLRSRSLMEKGAWEALPEAAEARLWKARALDMRGSEREAESAYRSHPAFSDPAKPGHAEVVSRLLEHLIENERLQEALDYLESGEPGDAEYRPLWRALLAKIYAQVNRPEAANALLHETVAQMGEEGLPAPGPTEFRRRAEIGLREFEKNFEPEELFWRVHLTILEGATLLRLHTPEQIDNAERAQAWAHRFGDCAIESRALAALAEVQLVSGDAKRAVVLWEQALECELTSAINDQWRTWLDQSDENPFARQIRRKRHRRSRLVAGVGMQIHLSLGKARLALGEDAAEPLDAAIRAARTRNRRLTLFEALAAKAGWLQSRGLLTEARAQWDDAAGVLETLRADLRTIESQIGLLENREAVYAELLASAARNGEAELGMRLMERAKGRAFLEQIRSRQYPEPLSEEQEGMARELRRQLVRFLHPPGAPEMDDASHLEVQRIKNRLAALYRQKARQTRPAAGAAGKDAERVSASGTTVVQYFVANEAVFAAVAHQGRLLPPVMLPLRRQELEQTVDTLQFELAVRERCWSLEALYAGLFAPLEALTTGASRLLIVPHDLLHRIPFHAFRSPEGTYLAERFILSYAPSLAVAQEAVGMPGVGKLGPAILLGADKTAYAALASLSFASAELTGISKWLPETRGFEAEQASRRNLLRQRGDCEILHCACHGEYDSDDPLLSRLYLADGPLYGYEIERLQFRARIAVLSACESGIQKRLPGDETFGLVRALLSRGFGAVIASLWKVADQSTALLMEEFYRQRSSGVIDAASALRNAQLQILASETYAHPFYWAPYFVTGRADLNSTSAPENRIQ